MCHEEMDKMLPALPTSSSDLGRSSLQRGGWKVAKLHFFGTLPKPDLQRELLKGHTLEENVGSPLETKSFVVKARQCISEELHHTCLHAHAKLAGISMQTIPLLSCPRGKSQVPSVDTHKKKQPPTTHTLLGTRK
jgi:hypothetical protein